MPRQPRPRAEIQAGVAAERRVHAAALGYQPMRMKPVHFATSFLLALTGRSYRLEYLNKASVPKAAPKDTRRTIDEYPADRLHPILQQQGRLGSGVDLESFRMLRGHLNAAFNNDGAALSAAFDNYETFGADYSAPSLRYVSNKSKNHGQSGSFVVRILRADERGREVLEACLAILGGAPPPLGSFGAPLLDDDDDEWADPYDDWFGPLDAERAAAIARRMAPQTEALFRLASNLAAGRSPYSLRYLVIGLCSWLFVYMMGLAGGQPLLLVDALQGGNRRIRTQSCAAYARQLDLFSGSYDRCAADGRVDALDWTAFVESQKARQTLDDHFRDLGVRIGIVQPRAANARRKHVELQADTLRVFVLSLLDAGEVVPLADLARRLREVWRVCVGADPEDARLLREQRFGPLDGDEDLEPNAAAFRALLVRLGLAVEPSDGLTLCAIDAEGLI